MLKTKLECESALINYFDAVNKLADDEIMPKNLPLMNNIIDSVDSDLHISDEVKCKIVVTINIRNR